MKLKAKEVPYSSVVGSSVSLVDETGAVVAIVMVSIPNPDFDYKSTAAPIVKKIKAAFHPSDPTPPDREVIARVIDPNAGWGVQLDGDYFDLREAQAEYEDRQRVALAKADAILALRGGE